MGPKRDWQQRRYEPESWRRTEVRDQKSEVSDQTANVIDQRSAICNRALEEVDPDVREQTRILELLGRVNYKIIKGSKVYVEVDGVVYKTLYGGYWRSVFTGIEHYLLRCEQVSGSIWAEENATGTAVDLPIAYSSDGWTARGYSLSFVLSRD